VPLLRTQWVLAWRSHQSNCSGPRAVLHFSGFVQKTEDEGNEVSIQHRMQKQLLEFSCQSRKLIARIHAGNRHYMTFHNPQLSKLIGHPAAQDWQARSCHCHRSKGRGCEVIQHWPWLYQLLTIRRSWGTISCHCRVVSALWCICEYTYICGGLLIVYIPRNHGTVYLFRILPLIIDFLANIILSTGNYIRCESNYQG
jgi:hypothetical protein